MESKVAVRLTATVLAMGSVIMVAPAVAALSFSPMQTIRVRGVWYIASADFNNDGFPDLVTAEGFSNTASVLLANGDGTFDAHTIFRDPEADPVVAVAVGNFNGGGNADVAVLTYHLSRNVDTLTILLGKGDGTFTESQTLTAARDVERPVALERSLAVGDLTGDGRLSVVTQSSTLTVFLGNGDGTFQAAQTYTAGLFPRSVVIGDFNGDAIADIAVSNAMWFREGSITVLPGIGGGRFGAPVTTGLGSVTEPVAMTAADISGHGILDVLTTAERCPGVFDVVCLAALSIGVGNGTFEPLRYVTFDVSVLPPDLVVAPSPRGIAVGDFNRDRIPDLVVAVNNLNSPPRDDVYVAEGSGDGSFSALATRLDAGVSPITPIVADFNLDGWPDIAVALPGVGVGIFINTTGGDPTFARPAANAAAWSVALDE
jgi:hypothetical protein